VAEYDQVPVSFDDLFVNGQLDLYPEVVGKKYFSFYLKRDSLIFQAGGYVGLIPINDRVILDVRPRVPVRNLERLLQVTNETPVTLNYLREYPTLTTPAPSLLDILARELLAGISHIEATGLHKEYLRQTQDTSFPRGRILMGPTMRHHALGQQHRVTSSWFEHSADTALNRCLKYAVWLLAQRYRALTLRKGQRQIIAALNNAWNLFARVSLDHSRAFMQDVAVLDQSRIPALRDYYGPILRLAVSIIENRGISFEKRGSGVMLPSMIFDFDIVFENYIRLILEDRLEKQLPDYKVLDGNKGAPHGAQKPLFDTSVRKEPAKPDVAVKEINTGAYELVMDAKYKPVKYPDRADIEQVIGYAFSYRAQKAVIVHPKKEGVDPGLFSIGTMQGYEFYNYIFDLAADEPEEEEERFAITMQDLIAGRVDRE